MYYYAVLPISSSYSEKHAGPDWVSLNGQIPLLLANKMKLSFCLFERDNAIFHLIRDAIVTITSPNYVVR